MPIAQLPVIVNLPTPVQNVLVRLLVLTVALLLIVLVRRFIMRILLVPLRRFTGARQSRERLLDVVTTPVRLLLIALALMVSARVLAPDDSFLQNFVGVTARVLMMIAALSLVYRLVDVLLPTGTLLASYTGIIIEERLIPFLRVGIKLFVLAMGVIIIVQELGYNVSGLIAGIGIGGLAISLAAQDTIANLFGFASIVGDSPFAVGDYIKTPDVEGNVEAVGLRSTRVRKPDQTLITLPNSKLANSAISNFSRTMKRWVNFTVGISLTASSSEMRDLLDRLRKMLNEWPSVEPGTVQVFFSTFTPSSLDVMVRCFIRKQTWNELMFEQEAIQLRTMEIISELGLSLAMPYPPALMEGPVQIRTSTDPSTESEA